MPLNHEARYKPMLFKYETTTRRDFNLKKIECPIRTVYKEKPAHLRAAPKAIKDIETLIDKQGPTLPFDLLWIYPKEILRTDPRDVQQPHAKLKDPGQEQARRTRPRVIICPMVSLDDIEDDESRNMVLSDMYKTTTQIAMEEVVANTHENNVRAPFPGPYSPARPLILGTCNPPLVSPELRMASMAWDGQQLRTYLQPKRAFWLWKATKNDEGKATEAATTK